MADTLDPSMLMFLQQLQGASQGPGQGFSSASQYGNIGGALGAGLGALGGPAGSQIGSILGQTAGSLLGGKKDKRRKRKLKRKIEAERRTTEGIISRGLSQQEALARQATQQRLGGFETAKRAAELAASSARQTALGRGQQLQGSLAQGLTNRGLGSTTVGANLARGISADTTRQLSGIDEALGNYFGQLAMGRAGVEAGGTESLANLAGQRTNFDVQNANFWSPYNWNRLGAMEGGSLGPNQLDLSSIYG